MRRYPKSFLIFIALFLMIPVFSFSQQGNIWYFGDYAGIDFNTVPITILENGALKTNEGCATISDTEGKLLFYTDGSFVYNKFHATMPNGTGLLGNPSSVSSAIIVPKPGSSTLFYVITADAGENKNAAGYNYSIVDMSLNGGAGDVTIKNQLLYAPNTELLTAFRHANGIDVWVVTKMFGNNEWRMYKIDCNGISSSPVSTFIGSSFTEASATVNGGSVGAMKASPDGKKLAVTPTASDMWEIYDFDNATGLLSNHISIPQDFTFGIEFSSDSKMVYVVSERLSSGFQLSSLYQYDISVYNNAAILASKVQLWASSLRYEYMNGIQMAPDGKIYCTHYNTNNLSTIDNPDNKGTACNFSFKSVDTKSGIVRRCLPVFFPSLISNQNVTFNYTGNTSCKTVNFSGTASIAGNLSWHWDFGDGNTATGQNVSHDYAQGVDNFKAKLSVTSSDVCGGKGEFIQNISMKRIVPVTSFGYKSECGNRTVGFTDATTIVGATIKSWHWDFGDGTTSTERSPVHTYNGYGQYTARLIATSSGACNVNALFDSKLLVKARPTADFLTGVSCVNLKTNYSDLSSADNSTITGWAWKFDDNTTSSMQNPDKTYAIAGKHTVKLTVTSAAGCQSDVKEMETTASNRPEPFFQIKDSCYNQKTVFTSSTRQPELIDAYWWNLDENTSDVKDPFHIFSRPGEFNIRLAVKAASGCMSDTISRKITIAANPNAAFNIKDGCTNINVLTENKSVISSGKIANYTWDLGNGDHVAGTLPVYKYQDPGSYNVTLVAKSEQGCVSQPAAQAVLIESQPVVDFRFGNTCIGDEIIFENLTTNKLGDVTEWKWLYGNGAGSASREGSYIYRQYGNFAVTLTAKTKNGCVADKVRPVKILKTVIYAGNDTIWAIGHPIQLKATGAASYTWSPSTYLNSPYRPDPVATPQDDITYSVKGVTAEGCIGYDTMNIKVYAGPSVYVPNAFTPSGPVNKVFRPVLAGVKELLDFSVYNRWGQLVFRTTEPGKGWDGKLNGIDQPSGTFVWKLTATDFRGVLIRKNGTVVIVR